MVVNNCLTLRELLKEKGIKQHDLAETLKIHESTVSLKVSGKRKISLEEAVIIAENLGTTPTEVFRALDFAKCKVAKAC